MEKKIVNVSWKIVIAVAVGWTAIVGPLTPEASAEPAFLNKQYTRCTSCHISPTGGGLLSSYGRSLSGRELSMTSSMPADPSKPGREEQFLWGALGDSLGPVQLGGELRPSHLRTSFGGFSDSRNILMTADVIGAVQHSGWTFYGEAGRNPEKDALDSYEHWGSYQTSRGYGVRAGRFFPAYGVRFADHTSFNRANLGFNMYDQVYGVELSKSSDRSLVQVTLSPGLARSFGIDDDPNGVTGDAAHAFNTAARVQFDLGSSAAIVASGVYREATRSQPRNGSGGLALGFSPATRVTVWTQADARGSDRDGHSYVLVNETSFEATRGLWLKVSPQLRTTAGRQPQVMRWALSAVLLPRTHFSVETSYYRDKTKGQTEPTGTMLLQFHAYL